jgi:GDP-L-fucose synthase
MTALILGATGMLGSAMMRRLPGSIGLSSKDCNLLNQKQVHEIFDLDFDVIYHCAGLVGGIMDNMNNQYYFLMDNAKMALNVIDMARTCGVEKVYYISSSCVYPNACEQPMKEKHILTGPLEPTNGGYAMAKLLGMEAARYAGYMSMIPCNLYGPNDNFSESGHVLASLVRKVCDAQKNGKSSITVWGNGTARREFLHVDDCADAIVAATQLDVPYINVGSGEDISIHDLARLIAEVAGWNGDIVFDTTKPNGMMRKLLDTSLLDSIGWKQKISLETGISQMITDYRSM